MKRVNYAPGQILSVADFQAEQAWILEKSRRHNRWLHSAGVVTGLEVRVDGATVRVAAGLGLDCQGNEIAVERPAMARLPATGSELFVCLHYTERLTDPVPVTGGTSDSEALCFTRIEESFALTLEQVFPECTGEVARAGQACGLPHALALARLAWSRGAWRLDRRFRVMHAR